MSALSYLEESMVPMRIVLPMALSGSTRTSLEPSTDSNDPVDFLVSSASSVNFLLEGGELFGGEDCCGVTAALDLAIIGALEGGVDGDDPAGAWYF